MILTETLSDWAEVWASLMARSLVDASLVLVIVGIVWLAFRRRMSPHLGYCLFLLVPAKLLIPIEIPVPRWVTHASPGHTAERIVARTTVSPARQVSPDFVRTRSHQPGIEADLPGPRFDLPQPSGDETGYLEGPTRSPSSSVAAALSDVALEPSPATEEPLPVLSTRAKLMIAWSAIVLGMMAYFFYTQWRFLVILRRAEPLEPRTLPVDFAHLKRLAGVRRSIRLLASPMVSTPAVHGLVRPSLLLPPDFVESVSPAQMRFVLLHELAHIGRRDLWVATFQRLVQMVYFFNPAVWIANWLIDQQREYACDDVALATGGVSRRESGEAFLAVVERANSRKPSLDPALGIFNPKHFFRRRLMRILDTDRRIRPKLTFGSAVLLVAMATILLPHVRAIEEGIDDNGPAVTKADVAADADKTEKEPARDGASEPQGPLVSAFGRVVDGDGKPMPGVTVHLRDWPTERVDVGLGSPRQRDVLAAMRTDEEGDFRFDNVRVPPFNPRAGFDVFCNVVAVAEGYALAWEHLAAATNRMPVNLTLVPESQVSGHIVDKQGQPIEGALVEAVFMAPLELERMPWLRKEILSLHLSQLSPTAKSDGDGRVLLDRLPPDKSIVVAVDHDDYRDEYVHVATTDTAQPDVLRMRRYGNKSTPQKVHSRNFTLTMEPSGPRLSGRITFADSGKPYAHASLVLGGTGNVLWEHTDEDGRYLFKDTMRPEYRITVFPPKDTDYLRRRFRLTLPEDGSDMKLDIELPIGQIVTGCVVDEDTDEGIPGVLVTSDPSWGKEPNGYRGRRGLTDDEGNFRVAVPPGKSILQVHRPVNDYHVPRGDPREEQRDARVVRMIEVTEGKPPAHVRFWLSRGLVINGLVKDADGKPVDGATVKTVRRKHDDPFEGKQTQTDEEGRFTMSGFPVDSRQYLDVTHEGRALYGKVTVDADKNALSPRIVSIEAKLTAAARVKGRVLVDGEPGDGIHIALLRDVVGGSAATLATAIPDAMGRYAFNLAPSGDKLRVAARGDFDHQFTECDSDEFVLEPAQVCEPPTLTIRRRNATVSGIAVDHDGNPLEGVGVRVYPRGGKDEIKYANETPTGKDGRFTIRLVPNGPLMLNASRKNPPNPTGRTTYSYVRVKANGGADDVRIVFQPES